jgi:uncharacterized protein (UPF0332 family)
MSTIEYLEKQLSGYIKKALLTKDGTVSTLATHHMEKARHNLLVGRIMFELSSNDTYKTAIPIMSKQFMCYDWVISACYYSMFHAATAAIGSLGLRARTHEALIVSLEYHLHYQKKALGTEDIAKLKKARQLEKEYVSSLWSAKTARNIAHYETGERFSKKESEELIVSAKQFIKRIEDFFQQIKP